MSKISRAASLLSSVLVAVVVGSPRVAHAEQLAESAAARIGPSFACPIPTDPLAQLICGSPDLSREDLAFVQAYQALRQQEQTPAQQQRLRAEAVDFSHRVRSECGVGAGQLSAPASGCVGRAYARQRDSWVAELNGSGLQEARRDLEDQIDLQKDLQVLGLLPPSEATNGVYGTATRTAILTFQQTMALPATGLLGDKDAAALRRQADAHSGRTASAAPAASRRTGWEDFQSEATPLGLAASMVTSPGCVVSLDVRDPDALRQVTREYQQKRGDRQTSGSEGLFAAEIDFLKGPLAARAVHAFYDSQSGIDRCRFEAKAFTSDIYGRDVPQPLFSFTFDRETYSKIVWSRFDSENLSKVALSFDFGSYAQQRLPHVQRAVVESGPSRSQPSSAPAVTQAEAPVQQDPPAIPRQDLGEHRAALVAQPAGVIAAWSGDGLVTTSRFHVDGPWELRWTSNGWFVAVLHQVGAENGSLAAQTIAPGASTVLFPNGGDYTLELIATQPWSVKVAGAADGKVSSEAVDDRTDGTSP